MECAGNSKAPLVVPADQSIKDAEASDAPPPPPPGSTLESNGEAEAESGLISSVNAVGEDGPKPGPTCVNSMCDSGFSSPQNEATLHGDGHESEPAVGLLQHEDDHRAPEAVVIIKTEEQGVVLLPGETSMVALSEVKGHVVATKKEREDGELTATEDEEDASQSVKKSVLPVKSTPSTSTSTSTGELGGNLPSTSEAPILTTPPREDGSPVWPKRSSLKRRRSGDNAPEDASTPKKKKKISFAAVTAYYFPRSQGFTCIPSQGGSTLGMSLNHSHVEKYSIVEHAAEQRRLHREFLRQLKQRQNNSSSSSATNNSSGDDSESGAEGQSSDLSDSELDTDNYYFLQPLPTRQRRALLRASGVTKIEPLEKEECRDIRSSRESCGCSCKVYCDPDVCSCAQAGIKCQVDRLNFPCGCTRDACANPSGRIEFNPVRVRTHFIHTLMRIELEANQNHHQQQTTTKTEPPTATTSSLACMEMEHNNHQVEPNNFGGYDPAAWNNAHDTYGYSAATTVTNNPPPCSFSNVATKIPDPSSHFAHFSAPTSVTAEYHPNVGDVTNDSSSHYANLHLLSYDCQLPVPDPASSTAPSAASVTAAATAVAYHPAQARHPNSMDLFTFPASETYHNNETGPVTAGMGGHGTGASHTATAASAANYVPFYDYNPNSGPSNAFATTNYEYYDNPTYEAPPKPYNEPASSAYYGPRATAVFEQVGSCATATVSGSTYGEAACYSSQYSVSNYLAGNSDLPTTELEPVAEPVFMPDGPVAKLSREDGKDAAALLCPFLAREEAKEETLVPVQSDAGESSKSDSTSSSDEDGLASAENNLGTIMKETMVVSV